MITRRDFINGVALAVASTPLSPLKALAQGALDPAVLGPNYYPPKLTGMRGSHAGSFELVHAISWGGGARIMPPDEIFEDDYDLIVVGGGLSGLAAAHFFRKQNGPDSRILILENHDDFGGHAKRNEFTVDQQTMIGLGGSTFLNDPAGLADEIKSLLVDLNIDVNKLIDANRLYDFYIEDNETPERVALKGIFFPKHEFGENVLTEDFLFPLWGREAMAEEIAAVIDSYPLSVRSKAAFLRLISGDFEFMPDASVELRSEALQAMPCEDFLRNVIGFEQDGVLALRDISRVKFSYSNDVLSIYEYITTDFLAATVGYALLLTGRGDATLEGEYEDYIYKFTHHFPDGNGGVARCLVRSLIPESAPGSDMDDVVLARFDYTKLDRYSSKVRIRLNSTAVDVRNTDDGFVDVTYVTRGEEKKKVRGKHAILACYNMVIPHICPEVSGHQAKALRQGEKPPMCAINVAVNNWKFVEKAGFYTIYAPESFCSNIWMNFPLHAGGYEFTRSSSDPALIHIFHMPNVNRRFDHPKDQAREGRRKLLSMSFTDFETAIVSQFEDMWGEFGFDAKNDIEAITVNRWSHGYAPRYFDRFDWDVDSEGTRDIHMIARAPIGNISIANSDSNYTSSAPSALSAGWRAVQERLG